MARTTRKRDSRRQTLGSLFAFALLAGFALVLVLAGRFGRGPGAPAAPGAVVAPAATTRVTQPLERLAQVLTPAAEWELERVGNPPRWEGRLPGGESMVHWNARITAEIEAAGLQVLDATEELVDRRGRSPLQRLRLDVGLAGERLAVIVVETGRSAALAPSF
jgi:hypothetical protein